jgi:uncharacterized coiled-coil DUF342 family protein
MNGIRETRPWFWVLIGALAIVAVVALVLAISAGNETVNQKEIAEEASEQVTAKVAGLGKAVEAADELQAESKQRAEADRKEIDEQVSEAVEGGEEELKKLRRRVGGLEEEVTTQAEEAEELSKEAKSAGEEHKELVAEVKELGKEVKALEREVAELEAQPEAEAEAEGKAEK